MRLDVREETQRAGRAELELNDTYVCLVSKPLADQMANDWSEPVQVQAHVGSDGLLEFTFRMVTL